VVLGLGYEWSVLARQPTTERGLIVTEGLQTFKRNEAAVIISCSRTFDPTFTLWKKIGNFPGNSPL